MDIGSSSSSRTVLDVNPGKQILEEGDKESLTKLNDLEIPNLSLCNSFDFMNEEEIFPEVGEVNRQSPPLSPNTRIYRENVMRESSDLGREEFLEGCNLGYISHYATHAVDLGKLRSWIDRGNGYRHRLPMVDDCMWMMPEFGMHGIPLILF